MLLDSFLEVDNNVAERAIKPFVICRKNFLFASTAKDNKLVVEKYLLYLFDNLPKIDVSDSESLEELMPWLDKVPENMKIKDRK